MAIRLGGSLDLALRSAPGETFPPAFCRQTRGLPSLGGRSLPRSTGSGEGSRRAVLCTSVSCPLSWQILPDSCIGRERLVSLSVQSREPRRSQELGSSPHSDPVTAWCFVVPSGKGRYPRCPAPSPHPGAPPVPVLCLLLARPVRRPSWSSWPSSAPRRTGNRCICPQATPPSTAGAPLSSTVKVRLAPSPRRRGGPGTGSGSASVASCPGTTPCC